MPSIQFGKVLCELHIFWWNNAWVSEVPYMIDWFATWSQASLWAILCSKLGLNSTRGASNLSGNGMGENLGTLGWLRGAQSLLIWLTWTKTPHFGYFPPLCLALRPPCVHKTRFFLAQQVALGLKIGWRCQAFNG